MLSVEQLEKALREAIIELDNERNNFYCDDVTIELYGWDSYEELAKRLLAKLS